MEASRSGTHLPYYLTRGAHLAARQFFYLSNSHRRYSIFTTRSLPFPKRAQLLWLHLCSLFASSVFFALPRELSDEIYHHTFQIQREIYHAFPPAALKFDLVLRYRLDDPKSNTHCRGYSSSDQEWLLASKAIFHEALEQFASNCEWIWDGSEPERISTRHWTTRLPIDVDRVAHIQISTQSLGYWLSYRLHHAGPKGWTQWDRSSDMGTTLHDSGMLLDTLRFVGYMNSYASWHFEVTHAEWIIRYVMRYFNDFKVNRWPLGYADRPWNRRWALFEWPGGTSNIVKI